MAAFYSRVFIIVDALDECQESDGCRSNLLREVFRLQNVTKTNFFATSRFLPEITTKFKACKSFEIRASELDVRKYVHDQIENGTIEHLPSLVENKPGLKEEIVRGISVAVDGMFLLAKIYLDSLVDKVTVTDVREALEQLPKQLAESGENQKLEILNKAYEFAWERINGQKEGFRNIAIRVLMWITCAKRPLSTSELQHALAVKDSDEELDKDAIPQARSMVSFCAGLVTIDEESNIIRLVHYTTQEYFEKKKRDLFPNAENMITTVCTTYISFRSFEAEYDVESAAEEREARLRMYPFYKYASKYWGTHAYVAGGKLGKAALGFLTNENKTSRASEELMFDEHYRYFWPPATGLHLAAYFGLWEVISVLLENGCDVNAKDGDIKAPLYFALHQGHAKAVEVLIDNGSEYLGKEGEYLQIAIMAGYEDIISMLIEKGADIEVMLGGWQTPLTLAADEGREAIVKLLLQKGADIEGGCSRFGSPLLQAALMGHRKIVELLLEWGANIDARRDFNGMTPLWGAVEQGHGPVIQLLLEKGAKSDATVLDSDKLLLLAARRNHMASIALLLEKAPNIHATEFGGSTPLARAAQHDSMIAIALLVEKRADVNATDLFGYTSLAVAARSGSVAAMALLLEKGANIEATDCEGHTPLAIGAIYGATAAIALLLEKGANIEAADREGRTPLWFAARCGHMAAVELLLKWGANIAAVDNHGWTPLTHAVGEERRWRELNCRGMWQHGSHNYGREQLIRAESVRAQLSVGMRPK
ncbi:hypothetical protein TARUN_4708 [Trichoderma arundinaceum]|uniref:Uncharacterized protein n=1 Tax=Trichoderma arundinaceum TaxID=490622 RepID=A0A395NNJ3_TRIAR|nr:hypothetical protein TARUN_4708 [Trichoderma arundinaceum]